MAADGVPHVTPAGGAVPGLPKAFVIAATEADVRPALIPLGIGTVFL
jgi:hypothetical protein